MTRRKCPRRRSRSCHASCTTIPTTSSRPRSSAIPTSGSTWAAKRDYEARALLAKAALYAAVRYHEQPPETRQPELARMAAVIVLRFAQVYPAYATHYDQPGEPKYFQQADLAAPLPPRLPDRQVGHDGQPRRADEPVDRLRSGPRRPGVARGGTRARRSQPGAHDRARPLSRARPSSSGSRPRSSARCR